MSSSILTCSAPAVYILHYELQSMHTPRKCLPPERYLTPGNGTPISVSLEHLWYLPTYTGLVFLAATVLEKKWEHTHRPSTITPHTCYTCASVNNHICSCDFVTRESSSAFQTSEKSALARNAGGGRNTLCCGYSAWQSTLPSWVNRGRAE